MPKVLLRALAITVAFLVAAGQGAVPQGRYLSPAVPVDVSDVSFPTSGPVTTAVSLLATVGEDGRVSDRKVVDSAGSEWSPTLVGYEEDSISAIKAWKFSPALDVSTLKPVPSVASITFVYSRMFYPASYPASLALKAAVPKSGDYVPPLLVKVYQAEYPALPSGSGAVVLVVQVETDGWVSDVHVIRSVPSLDEPSVKAVKRWTFLPARYLGKSIRSTTTVALVYLPFI